MNNHDDPIDKKLQKLGARIKNTSTVRFAASKRLRFNYGMANLTVVILSLWSIFISYTLLSPLTESLRFDKAIIEAAGLLLPVFIVVFSLIEGGENLVRAHLMELNARQLRELGDKFFSALSKNHIDPGKVTAHRMDVFEKYSKEYNDILERSPVNHDDIDHWGRHFALKRKESKEYQWDWWYYLFIVLAVWVRRQSLRILYLSFWCAPIILFTLKK
jgi:SMODS and SLOG-associating 2TM effector domain family 5